MGPRVMGSIVMGAGPYTISPPVDLAAFVASLILYPPSSPHPLRRHQPRKARCVAPADGSLANGRRKQGAARKYVAVDIACIRGLPDIIPPFKGAARKYVAVERDGLTCKPRLRLLLFFLQVFLKP